MCCLCCSLDPHLLLICLSSSVAAFASLHEMASAALAVGEQYVRVNSKMTQATLEKFLLVSICNLIASHTRISKHNDACKRAGVA